MTQTKNNNTSNKNNTLVHLQPTTEFDREASSKEYNYLTNDPRQLYAMPFQFQT